jgi:photosystem II stability/assembly factor-like uncharacterized protein
MPLYAAMRDRLLVVTGSPGDWSAATTLRDVQPECVAAASDAPSRAFVGTQDDGCYRTVDGGETFERVFDREPRVTAVAVSPQDPSVAWLGTEPSRVFHTTDGGASWTEWPGLTDLPSADEWYFPPRPDTHHVRWLEPDPHDAERLYVGIEAGAFVLTEDAGETWRERPPGSRRDNHSLATHPEAPDRVWAAAGDGYAESHDGGETWEHPQGGLAHRYCWSVRPDPGDPDTVVLSAASGARSAHSLPAESHVYRREDGGDWERLDAESGLPVGDGVLRAVLATGDAGEFYACNNRGLFRSTDAGETWQEMAIPWPEELTELTCRGLAVV